LPQIAKKHVFNKMSKVPTKPECQVNVRAEPNFIDQSLNDLDQEDPSLIEALKKMMVQPSKVNDKPFLTSSHGRVVKAKDS
jgi:hypothetical protein